MQIPIQVPGVWVYTTADSFNRLRGDGYLDFYTPEQKARVERIRQARLLFDGRHREYYLSERRSQYDFPQARVAEEVIQPYATYSLLGLVVTKSTDLLFGDEPLVRIDAANPAQDDALKALAERQSLHQLFYSAALDAGYEAEAFVEACVAGGPRPYVYLRQVPADEIFPGGPLGPDGQYARYDRYLVKNVGEAEHPSYLLLQVTYTAGRIDRACHQLDPKGNKLGPATLDQWSAGADNPVALGANTAALLGTYTGPTSYGGVAARDPGAEPTPYVDAFGLAPTTMTGLAVNTIVWVPNGLRRGRAVSDVDEAIDLQDLVNHKTTQVARVLAKHADPKLYVPSRAATDFGGAYASDDVFFGDGPDEKPSYLTWNPELAAAMADRDFAVMSLLVRMEMSPVLLGIKDGPVKANAYKAMKVMAMNALKRAERKAVYWTAGVKRCLSVAQAMENTLPGVRYDVGSIAVTLQDGIPQDDLDVANTVAIYRGAGAMSLRSAVETRVSDPAGVESELQEIKDEEAAKVPTALAGFMGTPMPGNPAVNQQDAGDEEQAATAAAADESGEVAAQWRRNSPPAACPRRTSPSSCGSTRRPSPRSAGWSCTRPGARPRHATSPRPGPPSWSARWTRSWPAWARRWRRGSAATSPGRSPTGSPGPSGRPATSGWTWPAPRCGGRSLSWTRAPSGSSSATRPGT